MFPPWFVATRHRKLSIILGLRDVDEYCRSRNSGVIVATIRGVFGRPVEAITNCEVAVVVSIVEWLVGVVEIVPGRMRLPNLCCWCHCCCLFERVWYDDGEKACWRKTIPQLETAERVPGRAWWLVVSLFQPAITSSSLAGTLFSFLCIRQSLDQGSLILWIHSEPLLICQPVS